MSDEENSNTDPTQDEVPRVTLRVPWFVIIFVLIVVAWTVLALKAALRDHGWGQIQMAVLIAPAGNGVLMLLGCGYVACRRWFNRAYPINVPISVAIFCPILSALCVFLVVLFTETPERIDPGASDHGVPRPNVAPIDPHG